MTADGDGAPAILSDIKRELTLLLADIVQGSTGMECKTPTPDYREGYESARVELAGMLRKIARGELTAEIVRQYNREEPGSV